MVTMAMLVSQIMLQLDGIRMRLSLPPLPPVIVGVRASSVIVIVLIRVAGSPTVKVWSASEEIVWALTGATNPSSPTDRARRAVH